MGAKQALIPRHHVFFIHHRQRGAAIPPSRVLRWAVSIFADMEEARGWQWNDPEVQRFINGCVHVTSWHEMEEYCLRRAAKGDSEVVIYQSPGYLMISGG